MFLDQFDSWRDDASGSGKSLEELIIAFLNAIHSAHQQAQTNDVNILQNAINEIANNFMQARQRNAATVQQKRKMKAAEVNSNNSTNFNTFNNANNNSTVSEKVNKPQQHRFSFLCYFSFFLLLLL